MEPSEEIRRVVQRWLAANREADAAAVFGRMSEHPGALAIGTDGDEWWHSGEFVVWKQQFEEIGGMPVTFGEIEAWEEGTVGWAATTVTIDAPEGAYDARGTYVLHLERGEWKVVQVHWSFPRPNADVWGRALPVTLEQLEQTIRRERPTSRRISQRTGPSLSSSRTSSTQPS